MDEKEVKEKEVIQAHTDYKNEKLYFEAEGVARLVADMYVTATADDKATDAPYLLELLEFIDKNLTRFKNDAAKMRTLGKIGSDDHVGELLGKYRKQKQKTLNG